MVTLEYDGTLSRSIFGGKVCAWCKWDWMSLAWCNWDWMFIAWYKCGWKISRVLCEFNIKPVLISIHIHMCVYVYTIPICFSGMTIVYLSLGSKAYWICI